MAPAKVLGIVGSPRVGGNTEVLVRSALDAAAASSCVVQLLPLAGKVIQPCRACGFCQREGCCVERDDDFAMIAQHMAEADAIILGSPVYWWLPSAQIKLLMDRTVSLFWGEARTTPAMGQCAYGGSRLQGKVGGALATSWERGGTVTLQALVGWFLQHGMYVGGSYDAICTGPSRWATTAELWTKGWIGSDARAMATAAALGRSVACLAGHTPCRQMDEGPKGAPQ